MRQNSKSIDSNWPLPPRDFARYKALQSFIGVNSANTGDQNVELTNNPGLGTGSGGPNFLNNTNIIVAVNSFGIAPYRKGNDYAFRTDTQVAYNFVMPYLE